MLSVQPQSIELGGFGSQKILTLTNNANKHIIYKAKTTNNQVMTAKPNIGIIPPAEKAQISIKVFAQKKFTAKIMVSYSLIDSPNAQTHISDIWKQLSQNSIQKVIIEVQKQEQLSQIEQQDPEPLKRASTVQKFSEMKHFVGEDYEHLYHEQVNFNNRLAQQIKISEKLLMSKVREEYEKRIISLFPSEQGLYKRITYTQAILGALVSFFAGYLLGKF